MKIYTKTGDNGETSLVGGVRVSKSDIRLEAYGTIDELNSFLGLLRSEVQDEKYQHFIFKIQNDLFTIGGYLATDTTLTPLHASLQLDEKEVYLIEEAIDDAVENVTLNFNIWVENSTIVADADIEAIFTVTGQNVTTLNGNLEAGAYIVRTAEGVAKVMVK